ncbi:MAG: NADH-quinone oxidoreductase subunit H [Deltaproteobacteria bacterium]|jgi:formate hydrogenlyase subunit 4|nr:NADH-quinone oxidoreductase subunit H [Deltaproteobacteria bacterium]
MSASLHLILAFVLAPLLPGIIGKVKSCCAGRSGKPVLQLYFDLAKLLRKGAVYSRGTSWVFKAGPPAALAATIAALCLLSPLDQNGPLSFEGDFLLAAYLLGMARFAVILAALDTGSSFEGMGASREAVFSALAEPVFLLALMPLGRISGSFSLASMFSVHIWSAQSLDKPALILSAAGLFLISLAENCRIPVDDPNTHLELTMIHEVMVLDHCGVDLAFIEYAAALKLWFFSAVVASLLLPSMAVTPGGIILVAVGIGFTESIMARLRLISVPRLICLAGALAALGCLLCLR